MRRTKQLKCSFNIAAFTLVELLVVIGIIAVLLGILLPVFSRAIESSRRTACLSNERQILIAILTYAAEHAGSLPGPAIPCVNDPRLVNAQNGVVLDPAHPDWSQMDVWAGTTLFSKQELSNTSLLQNYLGGASAWKVWQCPSAQEMWDNADPITQPPAGGPFYTRHLGFGYAINNFGWWDQSYPTEMFGAWSEVSGNTTPQKLTSLRATLSIDPAITGFTQSDTGTTEFSKDSTKIWLVSDLDGRNFSAVEGTGVFGIYYSLQLPITVEERNSCTWQPIHSVGSRMPSTQHPRSSFGRNYGFLDGHVQWLNYGTWPGALGGIAK